MKKKLSANENKFLKFAIYNQCVIKQKVQNSLLCCQTQENGRKFMSKNFKELLTKIYDKPTLEQREILFNTINDWRGNHEQVDDMLVMGIRM